MVLAGTRPSVSFDPAISAPDISPEEHALTLSMLNTALECWVSEPERRPSFSRLYVRFVNLKRAFFCKVHSLPTPLEGPPPAASRNPFPHHPKLAQVIQKQVEERIRAVERRHSGGLETYHREEADERFAQARHSVRNTSRCSSRVVSALNGLYVIRKFAWKGKPPSSTRPRTHLLSRSASFDRLANVGSHSDHKRIDSSLM